MHEAFSHGMKNFPLKGRGLGHMMEFQIFEPLYIYRTIKDRNFIFGECV